MCNLFHPAVSVDLLLARAASTAWLSLNASKLAKELGGLVMLLLRLWVGAGERSDGVTAGGMAALTLTELSKWPTDPIAPAFWT